MDDACGLPKSPGRGTRAALLAVGVLGAAFVRAADGETGTSVRIDGVCSVGFPDVGEQASVETRRLDGGYAWRIRYSGTAPRNGGFSVLIED